MMGFWNAPRIKAGFPRQIMALNARARDNPFRDIHLRRISFGQPGYVSNIQGRRFRYRKEIQPLFKSRKVEAIFNQ